MKLKNLILVLFLQLVIFGCSKEENENYIKPEITTLEVSEITNKSAICGGDLTSDGGKTITAMGIVWHTSANATLEVNTGKIIETTVVGEFKSNLTDLIIDTKYFVRAYATNEFGTTYGEEKEFTTKDHSYIEMVKVEGGTFQMGSNDGNFNEKPVHSVTVSSFEIGKYEVTQALWEKIMGNNPSHFKGDNLPVENVSWNDIQTFIIKLNEQTGKTYRLPTEAEWEYAARGGNSSKGYKYSGSDNINDVVWYNSNSGGRTHKIGPMLSNELGIYDMSGNVWEWCNDCYSSSYYSSSPTDNPTGPASDSYRVLRGGSWLNYAYACCVTYRSNSSPSYRYDCCGFRIVQAQ